MRHWLLRRALHYTDIQPSYVGRAWDYDKVNLNESLKANDIVYLIAANGELYGWGYVIKSKPYQDTEENGERLNVTVTRPVIQNQLVPAEEIMRVPALARLFANSDLILIELRPHQVNSFNRLIRSKGVEAPEEAEDYISPETHLIRLQKVYEAANGSRTKLIELMDALKEEISTEDEAWDEADYMRDEHWVEIIGDNGPPLVRLIHNGVKRAQEYISSSRKIPTEAPDTLVLGARYCPKCNRDYSREQYDYCTDDGTPLVSGSYNPDAKTLLAENRINLPESESTKSQTKNKGRATKKASKKRGRK